MAEFTGSTEIKTFDLLTVIVMIEQCEPELTVVTYYRMYASRPRGAPSKHVICLACLLKMESLFRAEDGRGAVIESARRGVLHIVEISPRPEGWFCPRCQANLIP